jgi:PPM family protein phosphatase
LSLSLRSFAAVTDRGRVRTSNEDVYVADGELGLFAVIDGMGGHSSGEVASQTIAASLVSCVRQTVADPDKTWPFPLDPKLSFAANRLQVAIRFANRQLLSVEHSDNDDGAPGATIAALLFDTDRVVVSHVGDCRVYVLRQGIATPLTRDHSFVAEQVEAGLLNPEQARRHPLRHVVTRALSGDADLAVDVREIGLEPNDRVLLCSDGVHGLVDDAVMARLARDSGDDLTDACRRIVAAVNDNGGPDNATVVLVAV